MKIGRDEPTAHAGDKHEVGALLLGKGKKGKQNRNSMLQSLTEIEPIRFWSLLGSEPNEYDNCPGAYGSLISVHTKSYGFRTNHQHTLHGRWPE
jgi:hypothetical protein